MIEDILPILIPRLNTELRFTIETLRNNLAKTVANLNIIEFTDHSTVHSDAVAKNIETIVTELGIELSADEIFIILTSSYLHDIGLFADIMLKDFKQRDQSRVSREDIRYRHPQISAELIENINFLDSLGIKSDYLSKYYNHIISKICFAHNKLVEINNLPISDFINNIMIRSRLLGAILYFGDSLHVGRNRVNIDNLAKINASLKTRIFWYSYSCIEQYKISNNRLTLILGKSKNITQRDFQNFVSEPIEYHFRSVLSKLNDIFESYSVNNIQLDFKQTESKVPETSTTNLFLEAAITESSIREKTETRKKNIETKLKKEGLLCKKIINNELIVLRRWSSYTPRMPNWNTGTGLSLPYPNDSRGGGYFLIWNSVGIAIDPGYDFLKNLWTLDVNDNNYFELDDIHTAIITHAHDDHCHDIEPIISLLYKRRKISQIKNDFHIYASEGTHIKYERLFSINDFLKITDLVSNGEPKAIDPQDDFLRSKGIKIEYLLTKHNETPWMKNHTGIAIKLTLTNESQQVIIGYTSDSQYFDQLAQFFEDANVLLIHFGNIGPSFSSSPQYDKNHLGLTGCHDIINNLIEKTPRLFLIDEFGEEEIGGDRIRLCELIKGLTNLSSVNKNLLPMDIGLRVQLPSLNVYCQEHRHFVPFHDIAPHLPLAENGIVYFCQ